MTINYTDWAPDTCSCILQYSWDDSLPLDGQTFPISKVIKCCSDHADLKKSVDIYMAVKEENIRKNISFQTILDNGPEHIYSLSDSSSKEEVRTLKNGVNFTWKWEGKAPNRVLVVSFLGTTLTKEHKSKIQKKLDNEYNGKVKLE